MSRLGRWLRALGWLVGTVAVLGGTPWALIVWVGNPMPPEGLSWSASLTDDALIGLLAAVVWVVWAQLLVCVAVAIVEEVGGVDLRSLPGVLGSQRDLARRAIAAMAVVVVSSTATASATAATKSAEPATSLAPLDGDKTKDAASDPDRHGPKHIRTDLRLATVSKKEPDLWTIAENHLGDGTRWTEIRELNQGRIMVDGRTFRSADLLLPGWKLLMPPDAKSLPLASEKEAATEPATVTYIVQPGDNLSTIAQRFLGDSGRYLEIFQRNVGRSQPDGTKLTDPDQIWPGWTLVIPGATEGPDSPREGRHASRPESAERSPQGRAGPRAEAEPRAKPPADSPPAEEPAEEPAGERQPQPAQPTGGSRQDAGEPQPEAPQQQAPPQPAPEQQAPGQQVPGQQAEPTAPTRSEPAASSSNDSPSAASADDSAVPVAAVAGVGAVVAAGLVGLFRLRRTWQRSRRRPGQRIPGPDVEAAALEETLTSGADVTGVELIDRALRGLVAWCGNGGNDGVLPVIQLARLTEVGVELYLAEPAALPEPWTSLRGETAWSLARDGEGFAVFNDGGAAPYPALVSLGNDAEMGEILVDLEYLRTLSLEGPRAETERMLAALTAGLATSQWADHLDVTIVGTHPELEGVLRTGRVKYLPEVGDLLSDLAVRAREDAAAWSELEVRDVTEARVERQAEAAGLCVPEIVLLAAEITPEQREQLGSLLDDLPRVAVAAVTTGGGVGAWRLRHAPDPEEDGDWILEPVGLRLRPARLDDATYNRILELVRTADQAPEGRPAHIVEPADTSVDSAADRPATEHVWPSASGTWHAPAPTAEELLAAESAADETSLAESSAVGSSAAEPVDALAAQRDTAVPPVIDNATPPVIDNLGPPRIVNPAVEIPENRLPRVLAFLCYIAENRGCSHEQLDEAMFPGARVNPETRTRYINYARTLLGKGDNGMDYLPRRNYTDLSPEIVTTWELFHNLVGDEPFSAPTDKLERALSLVRGRPYEGGKAAWYGWSEHSARRKYDLIADTACALADRRFNAGQWRAAVDAAVLGWSIEPVQQWLWRVHIQSLRALGEIDEARRIAQERNAFSEELEFELEPETERLFDELGLFTTFSAVR